jgi:hypothetical protein
MIWRLNPSNSKPFGAVSLPAYRRQGPPGAFYPDANDGAIVARDPAVKLNSRSLLLTEGSRSFTAVYN